MSLLTVIIGKLSTFRTVPGEVAHQTKGRNASSNSPVNFVPKCPIGDRFGLNTGHEITLTSLKLLTDSGIKVSSIVLLKKKVVALHQRNGVGCKNNITVTNSR